MQKGIFALKTVRQYSGYSWKNFPTENNLEIENPTALVKLIQNCTRDNLNAVITDPSTQSLIKMYLQYEEMVLKGHLGKTATFWLSIVNHTGLILTQ